uniref:Uncharacterized protein n=1 Tax=Trichogramma kaykai TaxID=54128 RepID=A0ABD2WFS0_9HYME
MPFYYGRYIRKARGCAVTQKKAWRRASRSSSLSALDKNRNMARTHDSSSSVSSSSPSQAERRNSTATETAAAAAAAAAAAGVEQSSSSVSDNNDNNNREGTRLTQSEALSCRCGLYHCYSSRLQVAMRRRTRPIDTQDDDDQRLRRLIVKLVAASGVNDEQKQTKEATTVAEQHGRIERARATSAG